MALADFQILLDDLARDQAGVLDADARLRALQAACLRYAADLPRELVGNVTWPALGVFGPVPAGWDDASRVLGAVYPIATRTPIYVDAFSDPMGGWMLECVQALPEGAVVRVTYTAAHVLDAHEDTIALQHRLPVAQYAASLLCHQLATYYSAQRETSLGADASMTETRARQFADRARELRTAYFAGIGVPDPFRSAGGGASSAVAAGVVSWPTRNPRHRLVRRDGV